MFSLRQCKTSSTHRAAIPQWPPDFFPASMNSDRPIRLMVGAIARGPIYLSTRPTSPEKPRNICSRDDTRMAPWICGWQRRRYIHMDQFICWVSGVSCIILPFQAVKVSIVIHIACWSYTYWTFFSIPMLWTLAFIYSPLYINYDISLWQIYMLLFFEHFPKDQTD